MNEFLHDQLTSHLKYWIGLNYRQADDEWQWLDDDEEVDYIQMPQRNRRRPRYECVIINDRSVHHTPMSWRDSGCLRKHNFICEKSSDCKNVKYGMRCIHTCGLTHCADKLCNRTSGLCRDGCETGYEGPTCQAAKQPASQPFGSYFRHWILHSFLVAAIFLLAVNVVVLARKKARQNLKPDTAEPTPSYHEEEEHEYLSEVGSSSFKDDESHSHSSSDSVPSHPSAASSRLSQAHSTHSGKSSKSAKSTV
ncbi:hypothetical protein ElyMa_005938800 [Elysia marginata]|uniref:C-type lectin domain-containing protein n=1 Tax=Elysia marginata TaxID=1093978 RepID=A0AAV4GAH4_9GAST|nr:hypothetical protein ElyMa_005938800 [Elysia marginata]